MTPLSELPGADAAVAVDEAGAADGIEIRHVRTHDEFVACVDLQMATWGAGFREAVPATIFKISQRLGGVTAGAFAADGTLLGFVFGMTGIERGDVVHWSDMLAVQPRVRNHGVGRRLKQFQREAVRALGATRMYWTYDPLVARNAHFNLNRLGAYVDEYVPDMYGTDTGSALHSGLGTDRFIVVWPIAADASPVPHRTPVAVDGDAPILNDGDGGALSSAAAALPSVVRVAVPLDIAQEQAESVARAAQWRVSTRRAFQWALGAGYTVDGFAIDQTARHGLYRLTRAAAPSAAVVVPTAS